jgi:hypothetical protein
VLCLRKVSVIYLEQMSPFALSDLPPDIGRATLHASVYVILQPIRRTASRVATKPGELLPHLFTLTPTNRSGFSLLRYSALTNSFPLGNMVLCVARTFLHSTREKRQTDLLFNCKDRDNILILFFFAIQHSYIIRNVYIILIRKFFFIGQQSAIFFVYNYCIFQFIKHNKYE